jgi:site-specific DNA-cytosine methylase
MPGFVEWLLGFPDGWTATLNGRGDRLKMLGNAVQVQCAEVIGRVAATL